MNLEAIALRRAEEQVARPGWQIIHNQAWKAKPKDKSRTARVLKCVCGECGVCKKRQWMRDHRAGRITGPRQHGKKLDPDRRCVGCGGPIAKTNETGWCVGCQRAHKPQRGGAVAKKRGWFSHGGGI